MEFLVSRASDSFWLDENNPPIDGCHLKEYDEIDVRTLSSSDEFDEKLSDLQGLWESKGVDHCINKEGYIQRTFPNERKAWFITVDTLNELVNLVDVLDASIIIRKHWHNESITEIEIYDRLRE